MHASERLLQLYAEHDSSKRTALQTKIYKNLHTGKSLFVSFQELTGETLSSLSTDTVSADDFNEWIKKGKQCNSFLLYYVELLERIDTVLMPIMQSGAITNAPISTEQEVSTSLEPIRSSVMTKFTPSGEKKRYIAETPVPSRAERERYQQIIKPARPRKERGKRIVGLLLLLSLIGFIYMAYPYLTDWIESTNKTNDMKPVVMRKPVTEASPPIEVWLTEKNVSLLRSPNSTNVTYLGDGKMA